MTIMVNARHTPATAHGTAGRAQGIALILPVVLPVMGAVLMAPVIPALSQAFATTPHADILVPAAITVPALMFVVGSPIAGWASDRFGRMGLLLAGLFLYAFCGTAPLWLSSLPQIILSRALLGLCEAVIMTCSTALIGDCFSGRAREMWLTQQSVVSALSAVVFVLAGGMLGEFGWRTPFVAYGLSVLLVPLILACVRPAHRSHPENGETTPRQSAGIPWTVFGGVCLLVMMASIFFYVMPIQIGFLLSAQGITAPRLIGLATAAGTLATPVGALIYTRARRPNMSNMAALGFLLMAVGVGTMAKAPTFALIVAGGVIHGVGWGIALPTMLNWAMGLLVHDLRGRGTGVFMSSVFVGQFLSPMIVLGLSTALGGLSSGILALAVAGLVLAAVVKIRARRPKTA
jgi:MFS family permease